MDIEYLINHASEALQQHGTVMPMVYLQLTTDCIYFVVEALSDTLGIPAQCGLMARLGWETCKKYPGQKPVSIGLCMEAWIPKTPDTKAYRVRPSLDPGKREVVVVEMWHADNPKHFECYQFPIVRDEHGDPALGEREKQERAASYQMISFLQGTQDAQRPEEEVFAGLERTIDKKVETLSPENRALLHKYLKEEVARNGL